MAIEVRQLVIKSTVLENPPAPGPKEGLTREQLAQAKAEILEECRAWLDERLRRSKER